MKNAKILETNEIKEMIAEKFDVPVENVIKMQYSFAVVLEEENEPKER